MSDPRWSDETERVTADAMLAELNAWDGKSDERLIGMAVARAALSALADAGLLVPASTSEVLVHPSYLANDNIRVNLDHPDGDCRWSVAFAAQPTNRVPLLDLIREVHRHDARCIAGKDKS